MHIIVVMISFKTVDKLKFTSSLLVDINYMKLWLPLEEEGYDLRINEAVLRDPDMEYGMVMYFIVTFIITNLCFMLIATFATTMQFGFF